MDPSLKAHHTGCPFPELIGAPEPVFFYVLVVVIFVGCVSAIQNQAFPSAERWFYPLGGETHGLTFLLLE